MHEKHLRRVTCESLYPPKRRQLVLHRLNEAHRLAFVTVISSANRSNGMIQKNCIRSSVFEYFWSSRDVIYRLFRQMNRACIIVINIFRASRQMPSAVSAWKIKEKWFRFILIYFIPGCAEWYNSCGSRRYGNGFSFQTIKMITKMPLECVTPCGMAVRSDGCCERLQRTRQCGTIDRFTSVMYSVHL